MDPVTLIMTALAAGAAAGVTDTASSAVKDAYDGLKSLLNKRLGGRSTAGMVLAGYEQDPETWRALLAAELGEVAAALNTDLVAAAERLMRLIDDAGTRA